MRQVPQEGRGEAEAHTPNFQTSKLFLDKRASKCFKRAANQRAQPCSKEQMIAQTGKQVLQLGLDKRAKNLRQTTKKVI